MSELLFNNIEFSRNFFIKNVEIVEEDVFDVQPEGFNNTIHWHVGHVLTAAEQFMFGFPNHSDHLPANYIELFTRGTKPADWKGDVPSRSVLISQLKDQLVRMKEIPVERLSKKLEKPILGQQNFGELINFSLFHENLHLGQIQAMRRVIKAAKQ
jgi:hypothetical protein